MKTRVFPYLLPFCVVFVFACGPTASPSPADAIPFDTATRLEDLDFAASGDGRPGEWLVIDNDAGRGLAQARGQAAPQHRQLVTLVVVGRGSWIVIVGVTGRQQ